MGLYYKVLVGTVGVLFSHGVAAQSLNLEQHFEQNTVWRLTSGGGPGIDCPEHIQLGDRGALPSRIGRSPTLACSIVASPNQSVATS